MTEKSYVSLGQLVCLVCDVAFDDGTILLDKRLRPSMERHTVHGYGLCPEHKKEGFIALIAVKGQHHGSRIDPSEADRTGELAFIKNDAFAKVFNVPLPRDGVAYVEPGVIEQLRRIVNQPEAT